MRGRDWGGGGWRLGRAISEARIALAELQQREEASKTNLDAAFLQGSGKLEETGLV